MAGWLLMGLLVDGFVPVVATVCFYFTLVVGLFNCGVMGLAVDCGVAILSYVDLRWCYLCVCGLSGLACLLWFVCWLIVLLFTQYNISCAGLVVRVYCYFYLIRFCVFEFCDCFFYLVYCSLFVG